MKYHLVASLVFLSTLAHTPVIAQSDSIAAQRSQLANQRIQLEAERRAREQEERLQQAEELERVQREAARPDAAQASEPGPQSTLAGQGQAADNSVSGAIPSGNETATGNADLSRMLEQLRTLGELRDAGYVTEEEFDRIKQRILDGP
jgi:hypothetical protein